MEYIEIILTGLMMLVIALQVEAIRMFRTLDARIRAVEIQVAINGYDYEQE